MQVNEFIKKLENVQKELRRQGKRLVEKTAVQSQLNALALIKRRIQQTGTFANGKKIGNYSIKPAYFSLKTSFKSSIKGKGKDPKSNKNIGKGNKKRLRKSRYENKGYSGWRDTHGLQTAIIDFTFSGDMWANIDVVVKSIGTDTYVVTLFGRNKETNDKLIGLSQRYGTILELSEKEFALIESAINNVIKRLFVKNGINID